MTQLKQKNIQEDIVFTPFNESALRILKSYIEKDQAFEVQKAFGNNIHIKGQLNTEFLTSLINPDSPAEPSPFSMMATVKTSYHSLTHIGYVQLRQSKIPNDSCYINYIYIFKAFRQKEYEYYVLRKTVEFVINYLKRDRCLIWISGKNYLFLSIAKTLGFRLVKITSAPITEEVRYCYVISQPKRESKEMELLDKQYGIRFPEISRPQSKMPDMAIPNYLGFKQKLQDINKVHAIASASAHRKTRAFYSPILKNTEKSFIAEEGINEYKNVWGRLEKGYSYNNNQKKFESPLVNKRQLYDNQQKSFIKEKEGYSNNHHKNPYKKLNFSELVSNKKKIKEESNEDKERKWDKFSNRKKLFPDINRKNIYAQ